jgi:hypothetical protein
MLIFLRATPIMTREKAARQKRGAFEALVDGSLARVRAEIVASLAVPEAQPDQRNQPGREAPHHRKRSAEIGHAAGTPTDGFSTSDPGIEVPAQIKTDRQRHDQERGRQELRDKESLHLGNGFIS